MDPIVHFELPATEIGDAKKFYSKVFGWEFSSPKGMDYTMAMTCETGEDHFPKKPGMINGGIISTEVATEPVLVIQVDSINKKLEEIKKQGGKVIKERVEMPEANGAYAQFEDTQGNILGLWEMLKQPEQTPSQEEQGKTENQEIQDNPEKTED